ncbi:MAG TPA: hypothetical protein VE571_01325 [Solirubrobacteraceae bacterium]|nr:hypothetical protein [Solirubrobacteraceae bacterium]
MQQTAAQNGTFSVTLPLPKGGYVVSVAASEAGATGHVQQSATVG